MSVASTEDTLGASMRSHSIIFRVIVFTPGQPQGLHALRFTCQADPTTKRCQPADLTTEIKRCHSPLPPNLHRLLQAQALKNEDFQTNCGEKGNFALRIGQKLLLVEKLV